MSANFKGDYFTWAVDDQGRVTVEGVLVPVMYMKGKFTFGRYKMVDEMVVNEKGITIDNITMDPGSLKSFSTTRKMAVQWCIIEYQAGSETTSVWFTVETDEGKNAEKTKDLVKILPEMVAAAKEGRLRGSEAQPLQKAGEPESSQPTAMDPARLEKLKKLVQVSEKLKIAQVAQILKLKEEEVYDHIVDWAAEFGFVLDEDIVKFGAGRKDDFIAALEKDFENWGKRAENKDGKV